MGKGSYQLTSRKLEILCKLMNELIDIYNKRDEHCEKEVASIKSASMIPSPLYITSLCNHILKVRGSNGKCWIIIPRSYLEKEVFKGINRNTLKNVLEVVKEKMKAIYLFRSSKELVEHIENELGGTREYIKRGLRRYWRRKFVNKRWYIIIDIKLMENGLKDRESIIFMLLNKFVKDANEYPKSEELINYLKEENKPLLSSIDLLLICTILKYLSLL